MRQRVHHHKCHDCGAKTECPGEWEQNYDGWPEVVCREFDQARSDFVCDDCHAKREAEAAADMAVS